MSNVMMINVLTLSTQASTIELYCGNVASNIGHLLCSDDDLILSSMQNKSMFDPHNKEEDKRIGTKIKDTIQIVVHQFTQTMGNLSIY